MTSWSAAGVDRARPSLLTRLLLLIPEVCGGRCLLQRRAAHTLRRARAHLSRLAREVEASEDPTAPLEHARAAVQHVAIVERWLRASARAGTSSRRPRLPDHEEASLLRRELGLAHGLDDEADGEEAAHFEALFSPPPSEAFVKVLPCLARSGSFWHPGKLYLSTGRLCFHSCVMGVEIIFGLPWSCISQARLLAAESCKTHPVRFSLRRPAEFDGSHIERLDVRLFDTISLGHVHRFATYFTGSGLFGHWRELRTEAAASESPAKVARVHSSTSDLSASAWGGGGGAESRDSSSQTFRWRTPCLQDLVDELEGKALVWELQRRTSIFSEDWRAPFLPHDGQKQARWVAITDSYVAHPYLPRIEDAAQSAACDRPPVSEVQVLGQYRPCRWHVVLDEDGDSEGWQYAFDFYLSPDYWRPYLGGFSHVRRRKWRPTFSAALSATAAAAAAADAAAGAESDGASTEAKAMDRHAPLMTSAARLLRPEAALLTEKGVLTVASEPLVEAALGAVPLAMLAAAFQVDDWQAADTLMARLLEESGARDLEVGPWASGDGVAARVKGKVRSVELRMPVPPAPMCPRETRCATTWHVTVTDEKVVLESVFMSLDVPYGTSFNVITCDTFTVDESSGETRMVRTCGVEWLRSAWMKSVVEANVPDEVANIGTRWAGVIRAWAERRRQAAAADAADGRPRLKTVG